MSATVSVVLVGAGAARLLVGVGGPAGVPISPLSFPKTRSSRPVVVLRRVPDRGSCVTVIVTATVMRGAATATTLGACLPVIAVAIIATVVTLSVSAWATGTMPSLGTAYAIPCWGVVPIVTASVRVGCVVRRRFLEWRWVGRRWVERTGPDLREERSSGWSAVPRCET